MTCKCKETIERILRDMNEFLHSLGLKDEEYDDIIDEYIVNEILPRHNSLMRDEECSEGKVCWHKDPNHESSFYSCFKGPNWVSFPRKHDFDLMCTTCQTRYNISTVTQSYRDEEDWDPIIFFPFKKGRQPSFFIAACEKGKLESVGEMLYWSTIFEEKGYGDDFIQNIYAM